jgi:hypothetical protein
MPTYPEDTIHIPTIQTTIFNHIHNNLQNNVILLGDFNRDITLIGRQNGTTKTPPIQQDLEWKQFTNSLHLKYIQMTQTTHIKVGTTTPQPAS